MAAEDAVVIDSTKLSEADVLAQVQELAAQRLRR
jgi:cytidylate kinase